MNAPSISVIQALQDAGAHVRAYDPEGVEQGEACAERCGICASALACLDGADAACIVTSGTSFRALDLCRSQAPTEIAGFWWICAMCSGPKKRVPLASPIPALDAERRPKPIA